MRYTVPNSGWRPNKPGQAALNREDVLHFHGIGCCMIKVAIYQSAFIDQIVQCFNPETDILVVLILDTATPNESGMVLVYADVVLRGT
jgi:hypothetical protein